MNNTMNEQTSYFDTVQHREDFCRKNRFLPVDNCKCQPNMDGKVHDGTQFFAAATFKQELVNEAIKTGTQLTRKTENLIPTAFVFESDSMTLQEQRENIREEAFKNILSITYSGKKSLHVVVPISPQDGTAITGGKEYKHLWREVAQLVFKDADKLDIQCATIGRLTRLPGATRNDSGKKQACEFYNEACETIDLKNFMEKWREQEREQQMVLSIRGVFQKYESRNDLDFDAQLRHLEQSNGKSPTPSKKIAIMVLRDGNTPSSNFLPAGGSYIGAVKLLQNRFPLLLEPFVESVQQAHPSCLPRRKEAYLI